MRFIFHLLWLSGLGILLYAALSYASHSMPYQDPTPELLAIQRGQLETVKLVAIGGFVIFAAGILLLMGQKKQTPTLE
ncbi:MAG: hypothetical protein WCT04_23815 [Planctomycetota bacterium]